MIPPIRWRRVPIECATPPGPAPMRPDAARPIVPMRPGRTGPGAVRLPLRATGAVRDVAGSACLPLRATGAVRDVAGSACLPLRAAAGGCIILLCMFYMLYMSTRWRSEP